MKKKLTKAEVDYSPGKGTERCYLCKHYDSGSCELVEGSIKPDYWCKEFSRAR